MPTRHYLERELDELIKSDITTWRFLQQGSLDGLWYWDLEKPDHEWMSPELWRLFGIDPATKKHDPSEWQDIIFADDLAVALDNFQKHCADPSHPYDQIVRYRHSDGSTVWVRCRGIAIRNADGKPIRMLGAHNDLTAVKRAEESAGAARLNLETVLDAASSGIIALNSQGGIEMINPAARHMLGGVSDATPFDWPNEIRFLDREDLRPLESSNDPVRRALAGITLRGETHLMTRQTGDDKRYVKVTSASISGDGSTIRTVLVVDDISDQEMNRQKAERASRLDALGQLTGGIAHDFNNLLATIQYALNLTLDSELDAESRSFLNTALTSVERGASLTNRLLTFAKRQPGLAKAEPVSRILDDFAGLASPTIEEAIALSFPKLQEELWVYCDAAQLESVLLNLVLNSRDAITRDGRGGEIVVTARGIGEIDADESLRVEDPHSYIAKGMHAEHATGQQRDDGRAYRYVEFSVTDDGPGMSDEIKRRAIDPFFTTKQSNSGTGLGLSMVYGFVQQSDGELRIYSEEGHGTTVRLILPRGTQQGVREEPVLRLPQPVGNGERILLVEDEESLRQMLGDVIQSLGYQIIAVNSGKEAMDVVAEGTKFDLLLTDIVMPGGIGGFDLARQVRAARPDAAIIYMSGYTGFSESEMGAVVAPMIQKPSPPAELANALKAALSDSAKPLS